MLKDRNDSRWKRIIVVGPESIPEKVFELDQLGRLIEKFPKNPYRKRTTEVRKLPASQSCPFLADNNHHEGKDVVSKFIDAILRYNEKDMSAMQLCYEQQQKQLQLAKNAQILKEQKQRQTTLNAQKINEQNQVQFTKNAQEFKEQNQNQSDTITSFDSDFIPKMETFPFFDELLSSSENSNEVPLDFNFNDFIFPPLI